MGEDELVRRILDEADMAARPGQYDRLVAIANEVAALIDHIATLKRLDDADTAEIDRLKEVVALRAEVERLRDAYEARDIALSEVAALRKQEWAAPYRREVLADLRAKVEGLPDVGGESDPQWSRVYRISVIRLIEEADQ